MKSCISKTNVFSSLSRPRKVTRAEIGMDWESEKGHPDGLIGPPDDGFVIQWRKEKERMDLTFCGVEPVNTRLNYPQHFLRPQILVLLVLPILPSTEFLG